MEPYDSGSREAPKTEHSRPGYFVVSSAKWERRTESTHDVVKVWNRGGLAGELVVVCGDGERLLKRLIPDEDKLINAIACIHGVLQEYIINVGARSLLEEAEEELRALLNDWST